MTVDVSIWHSGGAMPGVPSTDKLTDLQTRFVVEYVKNGGNASKAAEAAGYSEVSPGSSGWAALQSPAVQRAIHLETFRHIGRHGPAMLDVLVTLAIDDAVPPGVRAKAAATVLDRGGYTPPKRRELAEGNEKPLQSMTKAELEAFFRKRADAAKPVLQAAVNAAGEAEVTDIVEVDPT